MVRHTFVYQLAGGDGPSGHTERTEQAADLERAIQWGLVIDTSRMPDGRGANHEPIPRPESPLRQVAAVTDRHRALSARRRSPRAHTHTAEHRRAGGLHFQTATYTCPRGEETANEAIIPYFQMQTQTPESAIWLCRAAEFQTSSVCKCDN